MSICWILICYIIYWFDISRATTAPQQCAIAATTIVTMILPYLVARLIYAKASLEYQKLIYIQLGGIVEEPVKKKKNTGEWNKYAKIFLWILGISFLLLFVGLALGPAKA